MYKLVGEVSATGGPLDISMSDSASWPPVPGIQDMGFRALLLGDPHAGPYVTLLVMPPRTEPMAKFPPHGHGTDTWRISIRGTMSMGARTYQAGEFRYQAGGKAYGSDDFAWGPDGGFSVIIMADRRGTPSFPPDRDPEKIRQARARTKPLFEWLGVAMLEDYAEPCGIATTLERANGAVKVEGAFSRTESWTIVTPGTRAAAGLLGEQRVGPVLTHVHAGPGCEAFPASRFNTEVLHIAIAGSATVGGRELKEGDLRLVESGASAPAVIAGSRGFSETVLFGDRRGVVATPDSGGTEEKWAAFLRTALNDLTGALKVQTN